jgi:hypothetical protein
MTLEIEGTDTTLTVEQQVPPSPVRRGKGREIGEDSGWQHVVFYWRMTLPILKRIVEEKCRGPSTESKADREKLAKP